MKQNILRLFCVKNRFELKGAGIRDLGKERRKERKCCGKGSEKGSKCFVRDVGKTGRKEVSAV